MTQRERYRAFSRGDGGAKVPHIDNGPLMSAYERWLGEGLNHDLDPRNYDLWCDAFGLDRYYMNVEVGFARTPLFEEEVLEETETTITRRKGDGAILKDSKGSHKSIPPGLRPAVTHGEEWERLKSWLDGEGPMPLPTSRGVAAMLEKARDAKVPVRLNLGSLLGAPRNWLGFEAFVMLCYDDPAWFEDMLETQ
ncbi:MAG: hypothetical protein HQL31_13425, partial [Planctomycetes bacterium]|nr:hypothetical protein [Planctomycetota bacterium]